MSDKSGVPVAVVCGKELITYGPVGANGRRPLLSIKEHIHNGAARAALVEFEAKHQHAVEVDPRL